MRDYAKVEPKMWHGQTMKALRKCPEGVIVGMYLMTSPQSNMLGLFSQPVLYMAHETGLGIEGATKGLKHCIEVGFCSFDEESEFVWVHEMARYQIANELKAADLRCKGIQKDYESLPDNPFLGAFFDRYSAAFHLTERRGFKGALKAPTKPLRSQEQEQEKEQEQENPPGSAAPAKPSRKPAGSKRVPADFLVTPDMEAWASTDAPLIDWRRETEKFRDWEFKTPRTDWPATWRTWMRKAQEGAIERGKSQQSSVMAGVI